MNKSVSLMLETTAQTTILFLQMKAFLLGKTTLCAW